MSAKRPFSALADAWQTDSSNAKTPRRRADLTLETQVTSAIRDNLKPPVWTKYLIGGKLVRGCVGMVALKFLQPWSANFTSKTPKALSGESAFGVATGNVQLPE